MTVCSWWKQKNCLEIKDLRHGKKMGSMSSIRYIYNAFVKSENRPRAQKNRKMYILIVSKTTFVNCICKALQDQI